MKKQLLLATAALTLIINNQALAETGYIKFSVGKTISKTKQVKNPSPNSPLVALNDEFESDRGEGFSLAVGGRTEKPIFIELEIFGNKASFKGLGEKTQTSSYNKTLTGYDPMGNPIYSYDYVDNTVSTSIEDHILSFGPNFILKTNNENYNVYGGIGFGISYIKSEFDISGQKEKDTSQKFYYQAKVGADMSLGNDVGIFIDYSYQRIEGLKNYVYGYENKDINVTFGSEIKRDIEINKVSVGLRKSF